VEVHRLVSRDEWIAAFKHLTLADFVQAVPWTRTVEETHQVSFLASYVLGPGGAHPAAPADWRQLQDLIVARRQRLTALDRTPEEREAIARQREADADDVARVRAARSRQAAYDRALDRRLRGQYLMPHERKLLDSAP